MHGLIFETSVWLLAGSTRLISYDSVRNWIQFQTNTLLIAIRIPKIQQNTTHNAFVIICIFILTFIRKIKTKCFSPVSIKSSKTSPSISAYHEGSIQKSSPPPNSPDREQEKKMKLNLATISRRMTQLHSFQFYSTKLNEFSQNFNA